jgi:signal transduction histidine kinase/DNA-binding response OmpR family regulator
MAARLLEAKAGSETLLRAREGINPSEDPRQPRLIALAALLLPAAIFVAGIATYLVWDAAQQAEHDAQERAHRIVERVDAELRREIRALGAVAQSLTNVEITRPHPLPDRARLNAELFPEWVGSLVWTYGTTVSQFSSIPVEGLPPIPESWHMPALLDGEAVVGGIEEIAGEHVVLIHQAVPNDPRRLILTIGLRPNQFLTILLAHMPEESIGAIVDVRGNFVARSRDHQMRVGTQSTIYVRDAIAGGAPDGLYRGKTLEGFDNVSAFARSEWTGWSVHLAIDQDLVDGPLWLALTVALAGGAISIGLAGGLVWLVLRDIRRRQASQLALAHSQRVEALGRLTGGIAHDFNNLLTVIIGNIERSRKAPDNDTDRDRLLDGALAAARRAGGLTRSLLAYSRNQHLAPELVAASACVAEVVEVLDRTLGEKYEIVTDLEDEAGMIRIDRAEFIAALVNLAINARDAMEAGGTITLKTSRRTVAADTRVIGLQPGEYVGVSVIDTGPGMPPEVAARAFEPFFTTKPLGKGTGLGLAQVEGFARQSGGAAELLTEQGGGVTVTLYFPVVTGKPDAAEPAGPPQARPRGSRVLRVLLVEDDPGVKEHARHLLEEAGHQVTACDTAEQAEPLLRSARFDLLFSDVVLPGAMSGADLASLATQMDPGIQVLLATGYARDELDGAASRWRVLAKPYDQDDLSEALSHLELRQPIAQKVILIVEDEPLISMSSAEALEEAGYRVVQAATLREARTAIRSQEPLIALAIVDLGLPDGSGQDLLDELRDHPATKVLIASGDGHSVSGMQQLPKPYGPDQLIAAVRAALDQ